jgi:hypothetical protein
VPVLGAAGLSLTLASGASGVVEQATGDLLTRSLGGSHEVTLREEEIFDVSLATFYVFNKERAGAFQPGERLIKVSGRCLFACLAGQGRTEDSSALGNEAYSPPPLHPIRRTHRRVPK